MVYSEDFKEDKINEWANTYIESGETILNARKLAKKRYRDIYGKTEFHIPEVPNFVKI
jgi:hypothetical protein